MDIIYSYEKNLSYLNNLIKKNMLSDCIIHDFISKFHESYDSDSEAVANNLLYNSEYFQIINALNNSKSQTLMNYSIYDSITTRLHYLNLISKTRRVSKNSNLLESENLDYGKIVTEYNQSIFSDSSIFLKDFREKRSIFYISKEILESPKLTTLANCIISTKKSNIEHGDYKDITFYMLHIILESFDIQFIVNTLTKLDSIIENVSADSANLNQHLISYHNFDKLHTSIYLFDIKNCTIKVNGEIFSFSKKYFNILKKLHELSLKFPLKGFRISDCTDSDLKTNIKFKELFEARDNQLFKTKYILNSSGKKYRLKF